MRIDVRSRTETWAYWTRRYDSDVIAKLGGCLEKEFVVFDVGANVGFYSIDARQKAPAIGWTLCMLLNR